MYFNKECPEDYNENCDDMVNEDILEDNDWFMDDTTYGISCKCIIEECKIFTYIKTLMYYNNFFLFILSINS